MQGDEKIVRFDLYCSRCEHEFIPDDESGVVKEFPKLCKDFFKDKMLKNPCRDCLAEPARVDSRKPLYFKEKK